MLSSQLDPNDLLQVPDGCLGCESPATRLSPKRRRVPATSGRLTRGNRPERSGQRKVRSNVFTPISDLSSDLQPAVLLSLDAPPEWEATWDMGLTDPVDAFEIAPRWSRTVVERRWPAAFPTNQRAFVAKRVPCAVWAYASQRCQTPARPTGRLNVFCGDRWRTVI